MPSQLLAAGHVQELHAEMMSHPCSKPSSHACKADTDEWNDLSFHSVDASLFQQYNPGAQGAADHDNLHAAFQQLDNPLPIAMNTDATINAIKSKLYPDPVSTSSLSKEPNVTEPGSPDIVFS